MASELGNEAIYRIRDAKVADFAGNSGVTFSPTQINRWELISVSFQLVTDATVASRLPYLTFTNGTYLIHHCWSGASQAASETWQHCFQHHYQNANNAVLTRNIVALPKHCILYGSQQAVLTINAGVAGDAVTNCVFRWREWQEPYNL